MLISACQGVREPEPRQAQKGLQGSQNRPGDFTAALASFMAGGTAALSDLAGSGSGPGSGQEPDEGLLSPEPMAECHVSAAPPSVAGSVPGSSGTVHIWPPTYYSAISHFETCKAHGPKVKCLSGQIVSLQCTISLGI